MNRIRVAVVLLVLLAAFAAFGQISIHRLTDQFSDGIAALKADAQQGDYAQARQHAEALLATCHDNEWLMTLFIKHDFVNNLRVNLSGLAAYLDPEYVKDLYLELDRAEAQVEALRRQYFDLA